MLKNPMVRCVFRLFTLAVMLGALTFLVSTQRVNAGTIEECDEQYGFCIYLCGDLDGQDYLNCKWNCDNTYEHCRFDPAYVPLPAPYPVINHDFQSCMQACAACNQIEDIEDRLDCSLPCWNWCSEHYPKV
jgi:hypothetical protein